MGLPANMVCTYGSANGIRLASVPKPSKIPREKYTPTAAMMLPPIKVMNKVAPVMACTCSFSPLPQAWPTNTVAPADKPMMKAIRQNKIGKNTEIAAMAFTPIICPTKTVLMVPESDCKILVAIKGRRNSKNCCQKGRVEFNFIGLF